MKRDEGIEANTVAECGIELKSLVQEGQWIKILLTFAVVNAVKLKNISFTKFFDLSKLKHWILHRYHGWLVILGECVISVMHDT